MTGKHAAVNPATLGHHHVAVQFRDGKEPHCKTCGLTDDGRAPQRRPFGGGSSTSAAVPVGVVSPGNVPPELAPSAEVIARALREVRHIKGWKGRKS